jgi:hypothetical protein
MQITESPPIEKAQNEVTKTKGCCNLTGLIPSQLPIWGKVIYKIILLAPIAIMGAVFAVVMTPIAPIIGTALGGAIGTFVGSVISTIFEQIIRQCIFKEHLDVKELWKNNMITAAKSTVAGFAGGAVSGVISGALTTAFAATTASSALIGFTNLCATGAGASVTATCASIALRAGIGGILKGAKVPQNDIPSDFSLEANEFKKELRQGLLIGGAGESLGTLAPAAIPFAAAGLVTLGNIIGTSLVLASKIRARAKVLPIVELPTINKSPVTITTPIDNLSSRVDAFEPSDKKSN